jgi:predicted RNA binding protein with dsRBD fold (UPF0201 family)
VTVALLSTKKTLRFQEILAALQTSLSESAHNVGSLFSLVAAVAASALEIGVAESGYESMAGKLEILIKIKQNHPVIAILFSKAQSGNKRNTKQYCSL